MVLRPGSLEARKLWVRPAAAWRACARQYDECVRKVKPSKALKLRALAPTDRWWRAELGKSAGDRGYVTKEEKTFVRVVTMMTPTLLQAFGAVCARHGVLLASYRLVTDEVGVAHVRMELESLAQPLPRWLLTAVEGDLKRELAAQPPAPPRRPGALPLEKWAMIIAA